MRGAKRMISYRGVISALALVLCILTACGTGGGVAPAGSIPVQVTETDFHITSSVTTFRPGKLYHFIVTNHGQSMHEFMMMPKPEGNLSGVPMQQMDKLALASIPMIDPGEKETLDFTFPARTAGSHPEFACFFPGHYEAGMKLDVTILPPGAN